MRKLITYLKYDFSQLVNSKQVKMYFFIITLIVLIDALVTYISQMSFREEFGSIGSSNYMLLESTYGFIAGIYFFVLPVLASFPFSMQYYIERKNNFYINLIIRGDRNLYLFSKFLVCFFVGFLTIAYILFLNYTIMFMVYPFSLDISDNIMIPKQGAAFEKLFYSNIYLYQFIYILINSFVGGLFSILAFVLSLVIKYKNQFMVIAVPFIFYTAQSIILYFLNPAYDLMHIIQPRTRFGLIIPLGTNDIIMTILLWFIVTFVLFLIGCKKQRDVL